VTRTGKPVQVTDNGVTLWILQPARGTKDDEADRRRAIEEMFAELLSERTSAISASRLLEESRR
jgi:hypothetical protein